MDKVVLALDLGGTNARFAAVRSDGEILTRRRVPTMKNGTAGQILDLLVKMFGEISEGVGAVAIAAAIPALIKAESGVLAKLPNLPALEGINLSEVLKERTGLDTFIENDATAATIGEHWLGASKGFDNVIGITLGTGIGGGLIFNGKPFRGKDGSAGEIGHICVEPNGVQCGCGSRGCVEQYSSGTAIARMAREAGLDVETSLEVFDLGKIGEKKALDVFASMGRYLGIAIGGLVNLLNPDIIVICGGVTAGWDLFFDSVRDEVKKRAYRDPAERAKIVRGSLGDDAGILGVSRVAFDLMS